MQKNTNMTHITLTRKLKLTKSVHSRDFLLFKLRIIWYVRNEITHHKAEPPIEVSKRFLSNYVNSIMALLSRPEKDQVKGKAIVAVCPVAIPKPPSKNDQCEVISWEAADEVWVKLNTDGSFAEDIGAARSGMVLLDQLGSIVFSACRYLLNCSDPLKTELLAIKEGLMLALQWSQLAIAVETDCLQAVNMPKKRNLDRSRYCFIVHEISLLMEQRKSCITHIRRTRNDVSHFMANYGRTSGRTAVWLGSGPTRPSDFSRIMVALLRE